MDDRKFPGNRGKRASDERALIGKARWSELCAGVVVMVEQVVNLRKYLGPPVNLVPGPEVDDSVAG